MRQQHVAGEAQARGRGEADNRRKPKWGGRSAGERERRGG